MVDPPEKLSNDHAHDTQSFCLPNAIVELSEHRSERRAIGKLESLAGKLIERLAQGSSMESVISSLRQPRSMTNTCSFLTSLRRLSRRR